MGISPFLFWPCFAGVFFLTIGLIAVRRELAPAPGLEKLVVCGRVFVAASLAVFGAEHLAGPRFLMQLVPAWMPARLFWAYFVGVALMAAATSFVLMRQVSWSSLLLGVMIFAFVILIHVPRLAANPRDRISWAVVLRDSAFAGGAWALAGMVRGSERLIVIGRLSIAVAVIFFGVEHFLHPEFAPGVPLEKMTPDWVPMRIVWGYLTGAILLAAGVALLANRQARAAATWVGLLMTVLTAFLYLPILLMAQRAAITEGTNYVADTLLFGGTVLLLAAALPATSRRTAQPGGA